MNTLLNKLDGITNTQNKIMKEVENVTCRQCHLAAQLQICMEEAVDLLAPLERVSSANDQVTNRVSTVSCEIVKQLEPPSVPHPIRYRRRVNFSDSVADAGLSRSGSMHDFSNISSEQPSVHTGNEHVFLFFIHI